MIISLMVLNLIPKVGNLKRATIMVTLEFSFPVVVSHMFGQIFVG